MTRTLLLAARLASSLGWADLADRLRGWAFEWFNERHRR